MSPEARAAAELAFHSIPPTVSATGYVDVKRVAHLGTLSGLLNTATTVKDVEGWSALFKGTPARPSHQWRL